MSLARQNKGPRKDGPPHGPGSPTQRGRGGGPGGAWRGAHNNPSIMHNFNTRTPPQMISPGARPAGLPINGIQSPTSSGGPPDGGASGGPASQVPSLPPGHLIGSLLMVTTRTGGRYEGTLISNDGTPTAINLKDARDLVNPSAPIEPNLLIPIKHISNWRLPDPAPAPSTNGVKALDTFRTDTDISATPSNGIRERELKAWQPDGPPAQQDANGLQQTFGAQPNGQWDQFAANEKLFGVTTDFNEEIYTTKLDRNTADFKERERKAQQIANEIQGGFAANPHVREERNTAPVDENGANEEDKYGAVVRGPNAYVPPGARRGESSTSQTSKAAPTTSTVVPTVSVNGPDGAVGGVQGLAVKANVTGSTPAASVPLAESSSQGSTKPTADDAVASFRDFVTTEKQKLVQKKQAIAKSEKDKRLADLVKFSTSFKLNKPIPTDLVSILAKDEEKQKAILEKSQKDAEDRKARAIGQTYPAVVPAAVDPKLVAAALAPKAAPASNRSSVIQPIPPFKGGSTTKAAADGSKVAGLSSAALATTVSMSKVDGKDVPTTPGMRQKPKIQMVVPKIPPYDPNKRRAPANQAEATDSASIGASGSASGTASAAPASPEMSAAAAIKLNANASSFKPNPNASSFKPGTTATSPTPTGSKTTPDPTLAPNPYFGTRQIQKGAIVHIKDGFNPFKYSKPSEASLVPATWQFTGRRYMSTFPAMPHQPPSQPSHMPPVGQQPPSYEEDTAAQAQQRMAASYPMMFYNPYGPYPGAPPMAAYPPPPTQHMMAPPGNVGPPTPYMAGPYMQAMPYPQGMPPNGSPMYAPPPMSQMPQYLPPPPPQNSYQPNGRGSMPPTPIPQHAYAPYHHQSPQMGHQHAALPYQMVMPPPGQGVPPHGYDQSQQQPQTGGPMGVGH